MVVNKKEIQFENEDLPILISGSQGTGSSLFTIHLVHQLLRSGNKILFFTAFPAAKEDFKNLLSDDELKEAEFVEPGENIAGKQTVVLLSGNEADFLDALEQLKNTDERILLIKNIDQYSQEVFNLVMDKENVIFSGNLDETAFLEGLKEKKFATEIFFSKPAKYQIDNFIQPDKHMGMVISQNHNGMIGMT